MTSQQKHTLSGDERQAANHEILPDIMRSENYQLVMDKRVMKFISALNSKVLLLKYITWMNLEEVYQSGLLWAAEKGRPFPEPL